MAAITQSDFGTTRDGKTVVLYTLTNKHGVVAKIMTYGATVVELDTPDSVGKAGNITLGFDDLSGYESKANPFFGTIAGRVANRIANGTFDLNGKTYELAQNNGVNTLHGGLVGFDKKVWDAKVVPVAHGVAVQFHLLSPDGDENFPGNLDVTLTYTLSNDNSLRLDYAATTDQPTLINLTNHTYFNLSAMKAPTILDEILYINADNYTPVDDGLIPTGKIHKVFNTVFDFTTPARIGERINRVPGGPPVGYDHNFVLNGAPGKLKLCARAEDKDSGRVLEVLTTQPGVQFYTGNFLDGTVHGHHGYTYVKHAGFCLETQHYPDSIHHPDFPSTVLKPGQKYTQTTIWKFSTM